MDERPGRRRSFGRSWSGVPVLTILIAVQLLGGCAAARTIGQKIGQDQGLVDSLIHGLAGAAGHAAEGLTSAADHASAAIDGTISPVLRSATKESSMARSVFTGAVCDAIGRKLQTGAWPTADQVEVSLFGVIRGELQPNYGAGQFSSDALSVAQSIWTSQVADRDAVRGVVCAAVGTKF